MYYYQGSFEDLESNATMVMECTLCKLYDDKYLTKKNNLIKFLKLMLHVLNKKKDYSPKLETFSFHPIKPLIRKKI